MKKYCCITIDTEPDCSKSWDRSNPLKFDSIETGILKILQPLFQRYGIKPVYFISPEVLNNEKSIDNLKSISAQCEFGAHLHGEYIGPEKDYDKADGTRSRKYACYEYSDEVEYKKLENLTVLMENKFGERPVSFRAARFGADAQTFSSLKKLGYKVDSSVTPNIDWSGQKGPNFQNYPDQPYFIDKSDLLEIPLTIGKKRLPLLPDKWFFYKWLRPTIMTLFEEKSLIKNFINKYKQNKNLTLCLMFHSMEVIPQATPYVRSALGQKRFLNNLKKTIEYLIKSGFEFKTLEELYTIYRQ